MVNFCHLFFVYYAADVCGIVMFVALRECCLNKLKELRLIKILNVCFDVCLSYFATGSAPQVAISSSCHVIVAPSSAVGRFLLQVRQPGTRCQTISAIRRLAKTLLGDC